MKVTHRLFLILPALLIGSVVVVTYGLYHNLFNSVLEPRDVLSLRVEEVPTVNPTRLRIYLATRSSAVSVRAITAKTDGNAIVILVQAGLAKKGESGTIQYELDVPRSVNEVRFGHSSTPIWKRESPLVQSPK